MKNNCEKCVYYIKENKTCHLKKCTGSGPWITFFDKLFCRPREIRHEDK